MSKKNTALSYVHIGMFTNNLQRLIKFYQSKFGFRIEKTGLLSKKLIRQIFGLSCECRMCVLALKGIRIEIFYSDSLKFQNRVKKTKGINHWGYFVKDKSKFASKLARRGVRIKKIKRGGGRFVYFALDPDKNLIEIMEMPSRRRKH